MRTSKDDQIAVLEKATQNIKDDKWYRDGIQFYSRAECKYVDCTHDDRPFLFDFESHSFIVKPETIIINGVKIPKPLTREEIESEHKGCGYLYFPAASPELYMMRNTAYCLNMNAEKFYCYKTEEEAIEASKLLFGIKE